MNLSKSPDQLRKTVNAWTYCHYLGRRLVLYRDAFIRFILNSTPEVVKNACCNLAVSEMLKLVAMAGVRSHLPFTLSSVTVFPSPLPETYVIQKQGHT